MTNKTSSAIGIGTICFIVFAIMKFVEVAPIASWSWLKVILLSVAIGFIPMALTILFSIICLAVMWSIIKIRR